jgi:hypothetical protein
MAGRFVGMFKRSVFPYKTVTKLRMVMRMQPLNPWPRPIIGTIHAKSTAYAYSSTGLESCHESHQGGL